MAQSQLGINKLILSQMPPYYSTVGKKLRENCDQLNCRDISWRIGSPRRFDYCGSTFTGKLSHL